MTKLCRKLWKLRADTLRPALPSSALRAIPAATPARSMMRRKAMLAPELPGTEILREGGKQRSVIACPGRVLEQKGFDFGMDWHRLSFFPSLAVFEGVKVIAPACKSTLAPSQAQRIPEPHPGERPEQDYTPPIVRGRGFQELGNLFGCESFLLRLRFVRREVVNRDGGVCRDVSHLHGGPKSRGNGLVRHVRRHG